MGLCASTAIDMGDEYLVEGDIVVPKERLLARQRSAPSLVSATNVEYITVRADPALPAVWRTATQNAIAQWNNITLTGVFFVFTSGPTAHILVVPDPSLLPGIIAHAELPSGGRPGDRITVNEMSNNIPATNKLTALAHELGHTIGFKHTDGAIGALIPGTPNLDSGSVMNAGNVPWNGFSPGDILAVRTLYPFRITLDPEFTGCDGTSAGYLIDWGPDDPGVIEWQLQRRLSSGAFSTIYQGTWQGIQFQAASSSSNFFRVRASPTLGWTAWFNASFAAPDCRDDPPF